MIKVRLNEEKFRYDVFQMINLFYTFEDIQFVAEEADLNVTVTEEEIYIEDGKRTEKYKIDSLKQHKQEIRKAIFQYYAERTKKVLPWGTLIGIRPSKKALELLEARKTEEEIIQHFKENYLTREDKARLCIKVAQHERVMVNKETENISVYIGMPFCPTRCLYCSFTSNPIAGCEKLVEPYLQALHQEIKAMSRYIEEKNLNIECVYFGGGTPTAVNNVQFERIMSHIYEAFFTKHQVKEFTVECGRPDSITREKLLTMKKYKVHRISINPQTMNEDTLKRIGRSHTARETEEIFYLARELGFQNINMDLIVGLPGENTSHIKHTCNKIRALNPDSVTVHGMSIKRASRLYESLVNNQNIEVPTQEELNQMYEHTVNLAKELGMKPYYMYRQKNMIGNMENVGYAKEEKEGLYNIEMIEEKQTIIALGADAVSKVVFLEENRIERFGNVKDLREYVGRIEEMIDKKIQLLNTLYIADRVKIL